VKETAKITKIRTHKNLMPHGQGLSQLSVLRRQFVPARPLEGDKWEQLGDKIFLSF